MHANAAEWDYDEASLSLAKPLFEAELWIGREILNSAPLARLPPVSVRARVGNLSTEFVIARRHVSREIGPHQERWDSIWYCVDYNLMHFRDGRTGSEVSAAELTPALWLAVDRALSEGLQTFVLLAPCREIGSLLHFIGRRGAGAWRPRWFRSLGRGTWYHSPVEQIGRLTTEDTPKADEGWRFTPLPAPRLINAAGESVTHDGIANDPDFDPDTTPHHFVYEGKLGQYRIPVIFEFPNSMNPRPRVWRVDCRTPFEIRRGYARYRNHPALPGAARLSETEWTALEQTLISAFFNWPRISATGHRPLWIEFDRGYHEGVWGTLQLAVGWDNAITGLPDFSEGERP